MVVDAAVVVVEVVVDHVRHRQGPVLHQRLQHELLVARAVVAAQVGVVADEGAGAAGVGGAEVVLVGRGGGGRGC